MISFNNIHSKKEGLSQLRVFGRLMGQHEKNSKI